MTEKITLIIAAACFLVLVVILIRLLRADSGRELEMMQAVRQDIERQLRDFRMEQNEATRSAMRELGELLASSQKNLGEAQVRQLGEINRNLTDKQDATQRNVAAQLGQLENRFKTFATENELKLENIRASVEKRLTYLQEDNNNKLDEMRKIVDEKLQKTLEDKMNRSFQVVSERLEQVYKGLGEMQTLATGVGDLKKVLSNVKSRGILGEIQLGAILEEILSPEQYETNVATRKGSSNRVEFAIRIPAADGEAIMLPIDSKFPMDAYANYRDAYDRGEKAEMDATLAILLSRMKGFAKDIRDKYLDPPNTTEFGIMFLPFEGLYAEAVNHGMLEILQREYRVTIAGPSTMAALLNSLQMGFRTVALQKRSGEVWNVLGAVKTEFDKFAGVLANTQQRLEQANNELDALVGVRTRQIQKKLRSVTGLTDEQSAQFLPAEAMLGDSAEE